MERIPPSLVKKKKQKTKEKYVSHNMRKCSLSSDNLKRKTQPRALRRCNRNVRYGENERKTDDTRNYACATRGNNSCGGCPLDFMECAGFPPVMKNCPCACFPSLRYVRGNSGFRHRRALATCVCVRARRRWFLSLFPAPLPPLPPGLLQFSIARREETKARG